MPESKYLYCRNCEETTSHTHITDYSQNKIKAKVQESYLKNQGINPNDYLGWNLGKLLQSGVDKLKSLFGEGYKCNVCGDTQLSGGKHKLR